MTWECSRTEGGISELMGSGCAVGLCRMQSRDPSWKAPSLGSQALPCLAHRCLGFNGGSPKWVPFPWLPGKRREGAAGGSEQG